MPKGRRSSAIEPINAAEMKIPSAVPKIAPTAPTAAASSSIIAALCAFDIPIEERNPISLILSSALTEKTVQIAKTVITAAAAVNDVQMLLAAVRFVSSSSSSETDRTASETHSVIAIIETDRITQRIVNNVRPFLYAAIFAAVLIIAFIYRVLYNAPVLDPNNPVRHGGDLLVVRDDDHRLIVFAVRAAQKLHDLIRVF